MKETIQDVEASWLQSYYEALQFFYWEPQHLGRKKHPTAEFSTEEKVAKHLGKIEVTLNHNLSQFFLLAPNQLRSELFELLFGRPFNTRFTMHGREVDKTFELSNATQPDFMFTSESDLVSLEMKVGAKSSVSQVLKYALLGLAVELRAGAPREHYLGFLGEGAFSNQWQEKFQSIDDLRTAVSSADKTAFLNRQPPRFRAHEERFLAIVNTMALTFINYAALANFLRAEIPPPLDTSRGAEVYGKVLQGLIDELHSRGLAG